MEMWIARDKNGDLFLFQLEPFRNTDMFMGGVFMGIENYLFPEVTWENSPQKVTIELAEPKRELTNTAISTEVSTEASVALNAPANLIFNRSIRECGLSVRAMNCLKIVGIDTVGDLVQWNRSDLLKLRNFGIKTLKEIECFLVDHGLRFGMTNK